MKIYLYRNNQEEIIKYKEKTRLNPDEWSHIIIHKNPDYESGKNILTKSETQQIVQICGIRNIKNKKLLVCTPELFMYHKSSNSHITALRLEEECLVLQDGELEKHMMIDLENMQLIQRFKYKNQFVMVENGC